MVSVVGRRHSLFSKIVVLNCLDVMVYGVDLQIDMVGMGGLVLEKRLKNLC